jgi:hypothetical protein
MTPLSIQVPFPVFQDRDGQPLDNGYVWIGETNLNPQTNPVVAYFDAALTIPAAQPLRTINGYVSRAGTPAQVYIDGNNFSILVQDSKGLMIYNFPQGTGIEPVPNNASGIAYDPAGTGAVVTNVQDKLRETVSVKDFGAVGNGVADDTAAINLALAYIENGGELLFPQGTYKVTAPINKTFANGAMIKIAGYGAKIDGTSVTGGVAGNTTLITLGGARLPGVPLGTSAAKYATSITTASPISAFVNDIALITSTDLWSPSRPYYYKGEFIEMRSIVGNTIGSHIPLYDSYTNTTTTVHPLSTPTVVVEGLEIEMNANQIALVVEYCRNPSLRNLKIHGSRYAGAYLQYCFGGTIKDCEVYDVWYSGTGTSYGVGVATCQNVVVSSNNITEARHCITGGGWEPSRDVIYVNNICTVHSLETITYAIDHHENMEFCSIIGNTANGGIVVTSRNVTIKNNIVSEHRSIAQAINVYQVDNSDFYEITGNTVLTTAGTTVGIWVSPATPSISIDRLIIHDNNVKSTGRALSVQPRNASVTGCSIGTLSIKNNYFESIAASQVAFYVGFIGAATYTVTMIDSANNTYRSDNHDAAYLQSVTAETFSTNDKFYGNRLNGSLVEPRGTNVTFLNPYFEGNTGGVGTSRSIEYYSTGVVRCINPTFKGLQFRAELQPGGPTLYVEQGWYGATPNIANPAGAKLVNFFGAFGRAVAYGTAAPTTGEWGVGDRVYDQTPVVGQPKSWVCTVAGAPGTWVSEGNL